MPGQWPPHCPVYHGGGIFSWFVRCPFRFQPGHGPHTQISRRFLKFLTQARSGAEAELGSMNFRPLLTARALLESLPSFHSFLTLLNLHFFHFPSHSAASLRDHVPSFFLCLESESVSRSVVSDSLGPHGLQPTRLLCSWTSPGKSAGVGCHSFPQGSS